MNGSRSNTSGYGGKSSLDQLNRTIEGLEARIQGLVSERKTAPSRPLAANPVDEIIERQRALAARDRVSAVMERDRPPRHEPEVRYQDEARRQPEPKAPARPEPDYSAPLAQQSAAIGEIASTLSALRAELKQGLGGDRLAYDLDDIRTEMRSLKSVTANSHGSADLIRDELIRLGDSIDRLGAADPVNPADDLRGELEDLRAMAAGLAREDSVRRLESRWERTEAKLGALDQDSLKQEIVQLAWRIDEMKSGLGQLSAAPAIRALEDKLIGLAASIEGLGRNIAASTDLSGQFLGLDHRLDEISRAIAASTSQTAASTDSAAFQRLEDRIGELTAHIDMLQAPSHDSEVAGRIEALTQRVEDLANEDAALRLEERIGQLSKMIERNFRETSQQPEVSSHLADISRKIDGLNGPNDALLDRLDYLAQRLDELEHSPPAPAPVPAQDHASMSRLENRLSQIAERLDESVAAPAADTQALANLERQIASLSALMNQPSSLPAASGEPIAHQIAAIEDYMAASDEFIVEAARQAAEAVVDAYSRSGMGGNAATPADISAFASLAEDLRALETHTRSSEERTAETFSALHQTLVQIASRLDDLGERHLAQPSRAEPETIRERAVAAAVEPVRMPKAPQPDFGPVPMAPDVKPEVMRVAPKHSKVDILQDLDLMPDAADMPAEGFDVPANEPAGDKPASKSLIAGLAARLIPSKKEKPAPRLAVDPAPPLDAAEMLVEERQDSVLMEPGSGVPDVKKIMDKVRQSQKAGAIGAKPGSGSQADVIAAARRAAQAAAQEAGAQKFVQPSTKGKDKLAKTGKPAKQSKSIFGAPGEARRPILLAAAAVLLVVMSYPLVSNLISSRHADAPVDQPAAVESLPADAADKASMAEPAAQPEMEKAPVGDSVDTGAKTLMAPATDTSSATSLEKSDNAAPATTDATKPAMDPLLPADADAATSKPVTMPTETKSVPAKDMLAAAPDTGKEQLADKMPADSKADATTATATPTATAVPPAGLVPASLVEAVKKGDALAYFELGSRYTDGRNGLKVDLGEAAKWYGLAADKGMAPAEYRLGSFLEKGTGVGRDVAKAQTLYLSAAEKGNASAMHNLAVLYATGAAGTADFGQAAHWFQGAADLNIRDSQFNLAILYARGSGVKQDLTESYKWFGIAAKQGDQDAAQKRDEVANAMSAEQMKDAKAKLDLWQPKVIDVDANAPLVPDEWLAKANTTASVDMKRAIRNIQAILNNNGFDAGKPDGEMGRKTVVAIKSFQKSVGQEPTGRIDDALIKELLKRNKKAA